MPLYLYMCEILKVFYSYKEGRKLNFDSEKVKGKNNCIKKKTKIENSINIMGEKKTI